MIDLTSQIQNLINDKRVKLRENLSYISDLGGSPLSTSASNEDTAVKVRVSEIQSVMKEQYPLMAGIKALKELLYKTTGSRTTEENPS